MTLHRFHLPAVRPGSMELPEASVVHATRVLRLKEGDALRVFDAGMEFLATISEVSRHRVRVEVGAEAPSLQERSVPLHLVMSPLKGDLTELVIQKATELGVSRISPTLFERTDTVARREPSEARLERWRRVAVSAAEQAGRTLVPQFDPVESLARTIESCGPAKDGELRIVAVEPSLSQRGRIHSSQPGVRSVIVAVGPAGGLSPTDLAGLTGAGFVPESLASHTLRSETACIAAVAILGHRFS